jgi:hypothetical protein
MHCAGLIPMSAAPTGVSTETRFSSILAFSRIYDGHPVRSTCDVIGIGHLRSHLRYIGKRGIVRDDVRAIELLHEKIGDRQTLPCGVLGQIRQSSVLTRFDHDAWSRDLSVGVPIGHFTLPSYWTAALRLNAAVTHGCTCDGNAARATFTGETSADQFEKGV